MSTHNMFSWINKKNICGYPLLSGAMLLTTQINQPVLPLNRTYMVGSPFSFTDLYIISD